MGRTAVDAFARFFVVPQANHGLMASTADIDGKGQPVARAPLPSAYERFAVLVDWVERKATPAMSLTVGGGGRTLPLCSYPSYPQYDEGSPAAAASYACAVGTPRSPQRSR
jgi:feruloyl esterase